MINFKCLTCDETLEAPEQLRGQIIECPKCKRQVRVNEQKSISDQYQVMEDTKICSFCGEKILAVAKKCKHCGEFVKDKPVETTSYSGQNKRNTTSNGEAILFEGSPSQWISLGSYGFAVIIALMGIFCWFMKSNKDWIGLPMGKIGTACVFLAGLIALISYLNIKYTEILITSERVEFEIGWISKRIDNVDLFRVKDVRLRQGLLDRIIGIANIIIISRDASDPVIRLRGIYGGRDLYDQLKKEVVKANKRRGVVHLET